jgi:hypothetical protein
MKTSLILLALSLCSITAVAQRPDLSPRCKEEMKKLAFLAGDWKGEARIRNQSGEQVLTQTEHIDWKLDGLVLSVEGAGRDKDVIAFQAFALVNFDPTDQQFKLKSYVKEGFSTNAYFKIIEENKFEWGFDIPGGAKSKYVITLDPTKNTWHETGEYSRDGNTWMKFIELNLSKI